MEWGSGGVGRVEKVLIVEVADDDLIMVEMAEVVVDLLEEMKDMLGLDAIFFANRGDWLGI